MAIIGNLLVKVGADVAGLKQGLGQAQTMVSGMGGKLGGLGAIGSTIATGGLAVAGAAVAGIGVAAVGAGASVLNMSSDLDQAQRDMQSQLGLTEAQAAGLGEVVKEVFSNNFAGSIPEATAAVIEARQQLGALADEELQGATENALAMADAFGVDTQQSLNAAKVLMEQFGLSQSEAFDLMAGGFQRGLNSSDDFLDSITEYGNQFAQNGTSAGEFFSIMESGLQGGVLGTDKIADAFKEFGITLREPIGEDLAYSLSEIGIDANEMRFKLNNGLMSIQDAFDEILPGLQGMNDEVARNILGVDLFGTQWEDLGASAVLGIDATQTSLEDLAGASDSLAAQYDNFGNLYSGIWRETLVALEPVSGVLLDLANSAMPMVRGAFETVSPLLQSFGDWMGAKIPEALIMLQPYFDSLKAVLGEFIANLLPVLSESWNTLHNTFTTQIQPALGELFRSFGELMGETSGWDGVLKILQATLSLIPPVVQFITGLLSAWWTVVSFGIDMIRTFVDGLVSLKRAAEAIIAPLQRVADKISDLISSAMSMPDWLIPGSPTPFERGLRGIGEAVKALPEMNLNMIASGPNPALAGAGAGGGGIQIDSISITANDEAGGKRAANGFVDELRSRGLM